MHLDKLAAAIQNTYFARFGEMELEYQLHFASRLYAWNGDARAAEKLTSLRPAVMPETHDGRLANLQGIADEIAAKDFARDVNNYQMRKPYFEKYPKLLLLHNTLFRIRHWYCIYGVDERASLFEVMPKQEIHALLQELKGDRDAVLALSTYAINTFYLYEKLYPVHEGEFVEPGHILGLQSSYDLTNRKDIQLLMYLYTHCILGETLFYYQPVSQHADTYRSMLRICEQIIGDHYDDITLDNKFEFLVCARVCGFSSSLADRIYEEGMHSVNDEGFIVDVPEDRLLPQKRSFLMSEHRNVLFVMSITDPAFNKQPVS